MIPAHSTDTLGGNAPMQNFSIELNATMFEMLSSNVYTDTIMAPIREWSTNAVDACVAAGLPPKFYVHVPTLLEPWFSVRDYGTGLSNEDVLGLYSTLGASTKRNSNDFNGVFGIGRNSGLAYADSFQVDSYFEGIKISYLVTTADGMPTMISLGSEVTNEPNGLQLQLTVLSSDIHKFEKRCEEVYRFFEHRPTTNTKIEYKEPKVILDGDDWYLEDTDYGEKHHGRAIVIMGNVAYTIDSGPFPNYYALVNSSLRVYVPIGSVGITPGRESLSLDAKSVTYLESSFKKIEADVGLALNKKLDSIPNTFDKSIAYNEAILTTPNKLLRNYSNFVSNIPYTTLSLTYSGHIVHLDFDKLSEEFAAVAFFHHRLTGRYLRETMERVKLNEEVYFMLADTRLYTKDAVQAYKVKLKQDGAKRVHVIVLKVAKFNKDNIKAQNIKLKGLIKELGDPSYVMTSEYTPQVVVKSNKGTQTITATDFNLVRFQQNGKAYTGGRLSQHTDIKTFYYVETSRLDPLNMEHNDIKLYLDALRVYDAQTKDTTKLICGVPKGAISGVKKDARFKPLKDIAKDIQDDIIYIDRTEEQGLENLLGYARDVKSFISECEHKDIRDSIETIQKFKNKHPNKYADPKYNLSKNVKCKVVKPNPILSIKEINAKYPLLETLTQARASMDKINYYIKLEGCKND